MYIEFCIENTPRVLGCLDRNLLSQTYGCADWKYWHDKNIDIPSGHDQEMIYFLALIYSTPFNTNIYYKNKVVLEYIRAGVRFWIKSVRDNGFLDEFYKNEAQFGATAIVTWAMSETFLIIKDTLSKKEVNAIISTLLKSGLWLCRNDEKTNLCNHQSQALLALYNINLITDVKSIHNGILEKKKRVLRLFHEEGWFEEYDFFDPGYLTTTLSFLSRYWKSSQDNHMLSLIVKCLEILKYCFLPDWRFGGIVGSRNTKHCWPSTFEILSPLNDTAKSISAYYRNGLGKGVVFNPSYQDRYFVQQLYDYIWSYTNATHILEDIKPLPFLGESFKRYFSDSGIFAIKNKNGQCLLMNLKKGGVYHYCRVDNHNEVLSQEINSGMAIVLKNNKVISSDYNKGLNLISIKETKEVVEISIRGGMHYSKYLYPSPFKSILFRLFTLMFCRVAFVRKIFRQFLAKILIMSRKRANVDFERRIFISGDKISLLNRVKTHGRFLHCIERIVFGGNFVNIYVPYSRGFEQADLFSKPKVFHFMENETLEYSQLLK